MWRGANGPADRIFSGLAYLVPLASTLGYGQGLINQVPPLQPVRDVIAPFALLLGGNPLLSIVIFILLLTLVINNPRVSHFIRYNVMQSLLLMVILWLLQLVFFQFFLQMLGVFDLYQMFLEVISNTIFLGMAGVCGFGIFQCVVGRYAEIPALSDVVYTQIR
ncbi:Tic20 family protein [Anthocerotibacter panamensis]|uniref:Tic20 family protein n=1 Tax=Anthocerotibacter panamensis TaxID=2857077 RepID=UPI001C4042C7|nr:Tic20 family protein [Anthocerotibacter panamensis]